MDSGEYSDLTLLCEDQTFSVHKVVVCSQSKVLAAAMRKGFKVMQGIHCYGMVALLLQIALTFLRDFQESELNVIDLSADGAPFVSNLVKFLYTGNYPAMVDAIGVEDWSTVNEFGHAFSDLGTSSELIGNPDPRDAPLWEVWYPSHTSRAASARMEEASARKKANLKMVAAEQPPDYGLHVGMYALSNQYDIPALGAVAKEKLNVTCMLNWNPMLFIEIVPHVYESKLESNQGLRTVVLEYTRKHSNRFMKDELLKASFHGLLAAVPEFSAALLSNYMTAPPPSLGKDTNYAGFGPEGNKPHHCFCEGNCWCGHG